MSIVKAVAKAYAVMQARNWDTVYWAVDLHGVCLKSNYQTNSYEWINEAAKRALKVISSLPESKIILWSSVYTNEMHNIIEFFNKEGINIHGFNKNFHENSNDVSCFEEKFYFSVLLDDKAGFDPDTDWDAITYYLQTQQSAKKDTDLKPVVYYTEKEFIEVGFRAAVKVVEHPNPALSNDWTHTSGVLTYDQATGIFETRNTIYKPNILLG